MDRKPGDKNPLPHSKNGWVVFSLGDLIEFSGGSQPPRNTFIHYPAKGYIRLLQIRDYKTDKYETYIPIALAQKTCDETELMIGRYGPPIFQILRGLAGAYNVALLKAIPKPPLDRAYAYYFLKQKQLFKFVEKLSQRSSGQTGIDLVELKRYPFPLPSSLQEQKAIVSALQDVDHLILGLERLIQKKKAIQLGAMQQLLTPPQLGGKRLPGFEGAWIQKRIGEIAHCYSGATPNTNIQEYYHGDIPWISSGELNKTHIYQTEEFISRRGLENSSAKLVPKGALLLAMYGATAGVCAKTLIEGAINQAVLAMITHQIKADYLFQYLRFNKEKIIHTYTQGGQPNLSGHLIKSIRLHFPASPEEQKAIAGLLSDMDTEIEKLTKKKSKYEQVKQGMMEDLLTGKTRLW